MQSDERRSKQTLNKALALDGISDDGQSWFSGIDVPPDVENSSDSGSKPEPMPRSAPGSPPLEEPSKPLEAHAVNQLASELSKCCLCLWAENLLGGVGG